jgi:CHAT domain-containing protein/tetratricopeptide (TPR) repeat protein
LAWLEKARAWAERRGSEEQLARTLHDLGWLLREQEKYAAAEPVFRKALEIQERVLGPDQPEVAETLNQLAYLLDTTGAYAAAEPLYRRALAIDEKKLGPEHPDTATVLNNLAWLLDAAGNYQAAEPLFRRALAIREKVLPPDDPYVAQSLNNLAYILETRGDPVAAEPLYRRALELRTAVLGPAHPDVAETKINLANLVADRGDYRAAEALYRDTVKILEDSLGPEHHRVAIALDGLATMLEANGDEAGAESLMRRALAIFEKRFGPMNPLVATTLNNLGHLYYGQGRYAECAKLQRRALAIREKTLGPEHADVASSANNLAVVLGDLGDDARAEALFRRAIAIREKALGPEHPELIGPHENLVSFYLQRGRLKEALPHARRWDELEERVLANDFAVFPEHEKQTFAAKIRSSLDGLLSIHSFVAPRDPEVAALAFGALLRRKGRVLDASTDLVRQLRASAVGTDVDTLDELARIRGELSTRTLHGPRQGQSRDDHQALLTSLAQKAEALERSLGQRYAALRLARTPVTVDLVAKALGPGRALVELAEFDEFDFQKQRRRRRAYVAYVLQADGRLAYADLGAAEVIDGLVAQLRVSLSDKRDDYRQVGRRLDELVMKPIRALVGDSRQLYLSPDGALNLIPFAALVDESNRYLAETYDVTYLTSGRDVLRQAEVSAARTGPLACVAPAYDAVTKGVRATREKAPTRGRVSRDLQPGHFPPLPGTVLEGQLLSRTVRGLRVLAAGEATERAVTSVHGPRFLHIATHGFFLPDQTAGEAKAPRLGWSRSRSRGFALADDLAAGGPVASPATENALLRSGIALAGANTGGSTSQDDGLLTALEMTGLDLWGTKLVTLSACETGLGSIQVGEGVYGLRRALVLSGAETSLLSLWKVADRETAELMADYYRRIEEGAGRGEAMRQAQLERIGRKVHPFFWAAFIVSGDPRPLGLAAHP